MSDGRTNGCVVILAVLAAIIVGSMLSGRSDLESPDETARILRDLGIYWPGDGPPVVVFSNPG